MNCPKCNRKNDDTAIFCIYCGKEMKLEEIKEVKIVSPRLNPLALSGFIVSMASVATGLFGVAGIVGIILSSIGLSKIKKNNERGRGFALAGLIVGIITVVVSILKIMVSIIGLIYSN